jgi:[ribosomal protein S18]-alanine N-acetyltransferase
MPPAIRRATPDDIPAIRALEQRAPSAAHWSAEEYRKLVATAVVLVAEQESSICGMICAKPVAAEWELENVVVAEPFLRRGVADSLVRALLDQATRAAASGIFLEVRESNLPARRLYAKHGFRETGRRRDYYQNPPEDAILCARLLMSKMGL